MRRCFRSTNGGKSWEELSGLRGHGTGPPVAGRARGRDVFCTRLCSIPKTAGRIFYIAISGGGSVFAAMTQEKTWKADQQRAEGPQYIPNPEAEVGPLRASHRAGQIEAGTAVHAKNIGDVMRSFDAGETWTGS